MKKYPLASEKTRERYLERARQWQKRNYAAKVMWDSCSSAARTAVAEYIANQDGYTIYECCALKDDGDPKI